MKNLFKVILSVLLVTTTFVGCSLNKIEVDTNQNSDTYIQNEDYQNFLGLYSSTVKVDNGYYYISNMVIYFYDNNTKKSYPICNKINCNHSDDECSAYLSPFNFYSGQLSYYDGNLYVLGWETKNANVRENYLYQISLENFKRKKAAYLFDSSGSASCSFLIHRGYVYYNFGGGALQETNTQLLRSKLGDKKKDISKKIIFETSGIGASISSFNAYGNNFYFCTISYQDEKGNGYKRKLNCIDIHTLENKVVLQDLPYSYFVNGDDLYYQKTKNTINHIDLKTNSDELFYDINEICYISSDDNYIYLDNLQSLIISEKNIKRIITVLDKNGNYITKINPKNQKDDCLFGGNDFLIFSGITEDGKTTFYALEKTRIENPKIEFIDMD